MIKFFMSTISDCSAVADCEKCNALGEEIKCAKCKTGFSLLKNNSCKGTALKIDVY